MTSLLISPSAHLDLVNAVHILPCYESSSVRLKLHSSHSKVKAPDHLASKLGYDGGYPGPLNVRFLELVAQKTPKNTQNTGFTDLAYRQRLKLRRTRPVTR